MVLWAFRAFSNWVMFRAFNFDGVKMCPNNLEPKTPLQKVHVNKTFEKQNCNTLRYAPDDSVTWRVSPAERPV